MKKHLAAAFLATGSLVGHSQTVHLGLKVGANFSNFVGLDASVDNSYRFGVNAGALAEVGLGTHWAVQPEVQYSSKGNRQLGGSGSFTFNQYLGYLDVPLLLKYKTHHVFFEAGPQVGFLLGASSSLETSVGTTDTDNKGSFHGFDAGYVAGVGVQDTNGLLLGVRYNGGLTNVDATGHNARNSNFQLYVGYLFGSSKP